MKGGKEKGSTSASSCKDLNEEYLHKTPTEANHEKLEADVGTICCPSCRHKFEPTPEVNRQKEGKQKEKEFNN
jgi:hypothetical protein